MPCLWCYCLAFFKVSAVIQIINLKRNTNYNFLIIKGNCWIKSKLLKEKKPFVFVISSSDPVYKELEKLHNGNNYTLVQKWK